MKTGDLVGGRFVVEAFAGAGGMGVVYRARDRVADRSVAVKVLTEGCDARFEQEARLLAELDHPAIVRYAAHGRTEEGEPYLAMEWLDGEDLRAYLARARPTTADVRAMARRIAGALAVAHERGIVHRDIKPGNLFLVGGDPSRITVLDFGIARSRGGGAFDTTAVPITRTGMVIGTVGYMSPEQARGANDLDARADVFALGCVLFECITGKPAFSGPNAIAVLAKVLLEDAPRARHFEPSVPVDLDELVARMLSKDPEQRPRDASAVARALDAAASDGLPSSSSGAVADREKRMVTIVLVRGVAPPSEAIPLAGGAFLLEFRGNDPVVQAAATALAIAREHPDATLAIATGRVVDTQAAAYGPIIDRLATLQPRERGIPIDEVSATLLGDRYHVVAGALLGSASTEVAPRTLLGKATPMVGRDKELALLEATLRECVDEPIARCVLLTGAAGCGKSRLTHELLARVGDDTRVLIARGDPVGAGSSLGVARQLVRHAARLRESEPIEAQHLALREYLEDLFTGDALARTSEMLGELVGAPSSTPSPQLRAARDDGRVLASWVHRTFAEWIAAMLDAGPLLCVVEDLHWGDGASVAYLDEGLRANATRPLMVLALARPEVHDLFPSLWARSGVQEIKLPGLTRRAGERLVKSVLPELDAECAVRILERADGNAFRLEELIRHVAERGVDTLPESVLALTEARLTRLDPEARRLLRVASVFGETFWEPGLAALLGSAAQIPSVLSRLITAEVVVRSGDRRFPGEHQFRHGLLRDASYAMLVDEDRATLHLQAGEWLEGMGEKDALVLAEHFERAGAPRRAAPCFYRAAHETVMSGNLTGAEPLAERAAFCGAEGELLGRVRVLQSSLAVARGNPAVALAAAKEAYGLLPRLSPDWYVAAAHTLMSGAYVGDFELAPLIVQELLTTSPVGPPTGPYGVAIAFSVDILDGLGQTEAALQLLGHADALAARTVDPDPAFLAGIEYSRVSTTAKMDGDLGLLFEIARRGGALAELADDAVLRSRFHYGMGFLHVEAGNAARARELFRNAQESLRGAILFNAWLDVSMGWCDIMDGRHADAASRARKAFDLDPHHAYALAAYAHLLNGERSEAERLCDRALRAIDDGHVTPFVVALVLAIGAHIALRAGRAEEAERFSVRALAMGVGTPWVRSLVDRARIEVLLASGQDTQELLDRAVARIQRHARSLEPPMRERYLTRIPDNARILELAQR